MKGIREERRAALEDTVNKNDRREEKGKRTKRREELSYRTRKIRNEGGKRKEKETRGEKS